MKRVLRLSCAFVLLLMGLAITAWLVATKTSAPGQIGAAMYNDGNEQLRVEIGDARLGSTLHGARLSGLVLSEAKRGQAVLRLDTASVALTEFPSAEGIDIEHVTIKGLRLRIDDESGAVIQENMKTWGGDEEKQGEEDPGEDEAREEPVARLGNIELSDIDVDIQHGDWKLTAPRSSLKLSGVAGPQTEVAFVLDAAPSQARGPALDARTGTLHAAATLRATPAASQGSLTVSALSLDTLEAMGATLKGLRLSALALHIRGLSATLKLGELAIDATSLLGLHLTAGSLALSLNGSFSGARLESLRLRSEELRLDLKGSAALSIGFSGQKLPYSLQGSFEVDPSRLSPGRCSRGGTVGGSFEIRGDLLAGDHHLEPMDLSWSPSSSATLGAPKEAATASPDASQRWRLDAQRLDRARDWLSIPAWLCPPALPTPATPGERGIGDASPGTPTGS